MHIHLAEGSHAQGRPRAPASASPTSIDIGAHGHSRARRRGDDRVRITLRGEVLRDRRLKEKLLAAHRAASRP
jgi:ATP-dependent Lon protease